MNGYRKFKDGYKETVCIKCKDNNGNAMPAVDTQKFEQKDKCYTAITKKKYTDDDDTSKKLRINLRKHGSDES